MRRTKIDDELNDLKLRDPLLPPDANSASTLKVVPVHNHMDEEVESDRNPGDSRRANQLGVAEQGCGAMVVTVEES
jgi:hypothetical protein